MCRKGRKIMTNLQSLTRFVSRIRSARQRYKTERILRELPPHILKDIGWPDPATGREH
jgi:predicted transcriptional regulator